jgi:hypothetical protein
MSDIDLNALVEEKIEADAEFQATLTDLPDDEREAALSSKRTEVLSSEFASLKEQADKAAKAEELANNYKTRAEKAEAAAKAHKETTTTEPEAPKPLSAADIVALSKVHEEDIERVERFAKSEGLSIKEALQNGELKAILGLRQEERESANAANVTPVRRGAASVTDEALIAKANSGADLSDDELERVMKAKQKAGR